MFTEVNVFHEFIGGDLVLDCGGHLVELLTLENHKVFIFLGHFELHKILRNNLLHQNRIIKLFIHYNLSTSLFTIFNLLEFNLKNFIHFLEVLFHVILCASQIDINFILCKFTLNFFIEHLKFFMKVSDIINLSINQTFTLLYLIMRTLNMIL